MTPFWGIFGIRGIIRRRHNSGEPSYRPERTDWSSEHLRSRNGMLASPEPVEAFTFTFNLSQVGTLKIRGTFRAKNRQQPHPSLVSSLCRGMMVMNVLLCCVCIVLRGALVQLCCTIAFVKFDTHRAGPRWTGGGTPTLREFLRPRKFPRNTTSVGWFVPTQNIFAGECLRRFSPPQNL